MLPSAGVVAAVRAEYAMSEVLLAKDGRNFHGWAHRMRVREIAPPGALPSASEELAYVTKRINEDFANYSAWHRRSLLLPMLHGSSSAFLEDELYLVRQAFYTEPDVQSAWFYHRWLLAGAPARGRRGSESLEMCEAELAACQELLVLEPEARWVLHAKADLLERLGQAKEARAVLDQLIALDPMRRGFYEDKAMKLCGLND
jgi:geranylgeranyl transferase type-2 subunit alpha